MKPETAELMFGLDIQKMLLSRRFFATRAGLAAHYRAQRAGGLHASINETAGRKSNPRHARELRNWLKNGPTNQGA